LYFVPFFIAIKLQFIIFASLYMSVFWPSCIAEKIWAICRDQMICVYTCFLILQCQWKSHLNTIISHWCYFNRIKVITKLPNSEQSYKGKVKTHNYINRIWWHECVFLLHCFTLKNVHCTKCWLVDVNLPSHFPDAVEACRSSEISVNLIIIIVFL
jgi:hypothetical protein